MASEPLSAIEQARRAQRTQALRHLLVCPLILQHDRADDFALIVRHRNWLVRWFAENPCWTLIVDAAAGFARLHKVPARFTRRDGSRPAQLPGKPAFDRRRYVLLCLTLAALEDTSVQTTLARLAELVEGLSQDEPTIERFDANQRAERRAFVDVLRWLVQMRVLALRDGDTETYARSRQGNALYDVNERLLGQIIAAPRPPALAATAEAMMVELYPDTDDGQRLRARHTVFRVLLDDPVVYYDDLEQGEYAWLHQSRGFVYGLLEHDLGFQVERRKEGLAAVDSAGEVSDILFPEGGSTVKHAALLLAELLAGRVREGEPGPVDTAELARWTASLIDDYGARCQWSKQYMDGQGGAALLVDDALELLASFGLVARARKGWQPRPAIRRFAPATPTRSA